MPDGLGTIGDLYADALAKVGPQIWQCGDPLHKHAKKDEAARCIADSAIRKQSVEESMKARKPFANAAPPFGAKKDEPGGDADKVGWSGQDAVKHGEPGQDKAKPGDPPGEANQEGNFDGDDDGDDRMHSAESAGGGYKPEGDADRMDDFGKKKDGDKPKGDYGKVRYADPGYQKDGKPRYPIDTEDHVRAALSYINMPKNAKKYSPGNYSKVKGAIEAAAKRLGIEVSKVMASEADEIELAEMVTKTIETISMFDDLVIEKAGRRRSASDQMLMNMAHDAINKMTDGQWCMKAENSTQDTRDNPEHSAPGQSTDSGTMHHTPGENATQDTSKRGMRHSAETMGHLRKAHNSLCKAGASCPAHDGNGMSKAVSTTEEDGAMSATTDEERAAVAQALKKAHKRERNLEDKIASLTTQVSNLAVHMEYLAKGAKGEPPTPAPVPEREKTGKVKKALEPMLGPLVAQVAEIAERVEQIAKQPVPGAASHLPAGIFDISKAQDGGQQVGPSAEVLKGLTDAQLRALEEVKKKMTPEQAQQFQWRLDYQRSLNNPYVQQR